MLEVRGILKSARRIMESFQQGFDALVTGSPALAFLTSRGATDIRNTLS